MMTLAQNGRIVAKALSFSGDMPTQPDQTSAARKASSSGQDRMVPG